ncbi:hypothetical protein BH23BAC3_BH23BAC3_26970 [soil metagenome]
MPLAFAAIIAMLLNPVIERFEIWKMGWMFSIILVLFLITLIFSGFLLRIIVQVLEFSDKLPEITEKLKSTSVEGIIAIERISGISEDRQTVYVKNVIDNLFDSGGEFLNSLAGATTGTFTFLALLPIFIFFMLYYKEMYKTFLQRIFKKSQNSVRRLWKIEIQKNNVGERIIFFNELVLQEFCTPTHKP